MHYVLGPLQYIASKHRVHLFGRGIFDFGLSQSTYPHSATGNREPLSFPSLPLPSVSYFFILHSFSFLLRSLSLFLLAEGTSYPPHFSSLSSLLHLLPVPFSRSLSCLIFPIPYHFSHSLLSLSRPLSLLRLSLSLFFSFSLFLSPITINTLIPLSSSTLSLSHLSHLYYYRLLHISLIQVFSFSVPDQHLLPSPKSTFQQHSFIKQQEQQPTTKATNQHK